MTSLQVVGNYKFQFQPLNRIHKKGSKDLDTKNYFNIFIRFQS